MNTFDIVFSVTCCLLALVLFAHRKGYRDGYDKGVTDGYEDYKHDILTGDQGNECMEGS